MFKKFRHVILASVLALATLMSAVPALAQCGSCPSGTVVVTSGTATNADVVFINRVNALFADFSRNFLLVQNTLGTARALTLSGQIISLTVSEIELRAGLFGVTVDQFIMAEIIARSINVSTTRVIVSLGNRTFGDVALQFGIPFAVLNARVTAFNAVFLSELGAEPGSGAEGSGTVNINIIIQIFGGLEDRLGNLEGRVGLTTLEDILLNVLAQETSSDRTIIRTFRGRFSQLSAAEFAQLMLMADLIADVSNTHLDVVLGDGADISIITPYGAARAMTANGIVTQVVVSRVDVITRLTRLAANGTFDPAFQVPDETGDTTAP